MTKSLIRDYTLKGIADAIREKKGFIGYWVVNSMVHYEFKDDGTCKIIMPTLDNYSEFTYHYDDTKIYLEQEGSDGYEYEYEFLDNGDLQFTEEISGGDTRTFTLHHEEYLPSEMDDEINALPYTDTEEDVFNMILEPNSGSTFQSSSFVPIKKPVIINVHLTDNTSLGNKFINVIKTTFSDITIKGHILGKSNQNAPSLNFQDSSSKKIDIGDLYIDESNYTESFSSTWLDMYFRNCKQLEHLVLPKKYNVYRIDMSQGYLLDFSNDIKLKTIENLDEAYKYMFPHATYSSYYSGYYTRDLFRGCSSIESLFLNMEYLTQTEHDYLLWDTCYGCTSLKSFEFRNSQLLQGNIKISEMFYNCSSLETVTGIDSIPPDKITSIYSLFYGCSKLASLPLICQETNLNDIHDMVRNSGITGSYTLNYPNLNSGYNAFSSSNITGVSLYIGNNEMTSSNFINLSNMFASCALLEHAIITSRGEPLISLSSTFEYSQNLIDAEINIKTANTLYRTFYECRNLTSVDMSAVSFSSTASNVSIDNLFYHCYNLTDIDIRNLDLSQASSTTSNATFSSLPSGCTIHVKNEASKQFIEIRNSNLNIIVEEV